MNAYAPPPDTIALGSGKYFSFADPAASDFDIHDIARALSNTCRFGGHSCRFYSVAEHSVHASRIVPNAHAYGALMHDAAEAFTGDMVKPLKELLPDFAEVERKVEEVVAARFGFAAATPRVVKEADMAMLAAEQRQVMGNGDQWCHTHGREAADVVIEFWGPEEAERRFLDRFRELAPRRVGGSL